MRYADNFVMLIQDGEEHVHASRADVAATPWVLRYPSVSPTVRWHQDAARHQFHKGPN